MKTTDKSWSCYLPQSPEAEQWGLFVLDAGYTVIPPNSPYPPGPHPDDHMSVTSGRTLDTFTLVYITRGGGTFESPDPILIKSYSAATSFLSSSTAHINPTTPSSRMPIGSGNRRVHPIHYNYNRHTELAPNSAETIDMWVNDINDYEENYQAYAGSRA